MVAIDRSKRDESNESKIYKTLVKIRANGTFHYYQTKLPLAKLRDHSSIDRPHSKSLYVSFGKSLEETRFYFADAALAKLTEDAIAGTSLDRSGVNQSMSYSDLDSLFRSLSNSLRFIIEAHLRVRKLVIEQEVNAPRP